MENKPLVKVWWEDHHSSELNTPYPEDEWEDLCQPAVRITAGFLIYENKKCILIAGTDEQDGTYTEITTIIKKNIVKIDD